MSSGGLPFAEASVADGANGGDNIRAGQKEIVLTRWGTSF